MKYRHNSYTDSQGKVCYFIEYNDTNKDYGEDWYELEDLEEKMAIDIAKLLNSKYSTPPYYKYGEPLSNN